MSEDDSQSADGYQYQSTLNGDGNWIKPAYHMIHTGIYLAPVCQKMTARVMTGIDIKALSTVMGIGANVAASGMIASGV